jgi:uncharacterized membrane protein YbjE (DUF340 family)
MLTAAFYWSIMVGCYLIASLLRKHSDKFAFLPKAMMASIYVLVFTMGLKLGINEQVTSSLGTIGVQALVMSVCIILGSILAVFLLRKLLHMDRYGVMSSVGASGSTDKVKIEDTPPNTDAAPTKEEGMSIGSTVIIFAMTAVGIVIGKFIVADNFPDILPSFTEGVSQALSFFLCILIAVIGFDLGLDGTVIPNLKSVGIRIFAFPIAIALGSFIVGTLVGHFFGFSIKESLAISAGFGWYSYAPAIITSAGSQYAVAGAVSFLHNVIREMSGILLIPIVAKKFGYMEAIALPGIGTMDVCMPIISRACKQYMVVYAFANGAVLCIITSVMVPLLMGV